MPMQAQPTLKTKTAPADPAPASTAATQNSDPRLVNIPVVVLDKRGALVKDLTKDNFEIKVDNRPQTIHSFSVDTDLPLTLGLVVDTSMSQRDAIDDERVASTAFLNEMLAAPASRDKAFVVQFAQQTDLLQDTTDSKTLLQSALKQLDTARASGKSGGDQSGSEPVGTAAGRARRDANTLYDALFLSSNEVIGKQKGRNVLIVLSDGIDSGSKESVASAIEAALRADAIVYAIYFKGRVETDRGFHVGSGGDPNDPNNYPGGYSGGYPGCYPGGYPGGYPGSNPGTQPRNVPIADGRKTLEHIAEQTGGRVFEVSKKESLADIYKEIGEELRAQYWLAYAPEKDQSSDGYHRIDLSFSKSTANAKDLYLQSRDGYYVGE